MKKLLCLILSLSLILSLPITAAADTDGNIFAGRVSTAGGNLNVRSSPSASSYIKTSIKNGSLITVLSENGSFYYVRYGNSSYGYCHKSYVKIISENAVTVNTEWGNLNVRTGAGTSYSVKDRLGKGEKAVVLSENGSWSEVLYKGNKTGYVKSSYLKSIPVRNRPVSLAVPYFKQTDSRWSWVEIGQSGKTIGKIGCATTSISMIESFRQGENITPDIMSKRLSYSQSGNVYWPSDYKVTLSSDNYLQKIYSVLKEGKPVLFGAKNKYGSQHWIVITGFRGGELIPSNFVINDPGSSSRTALSQFLSIYPVFYKYFSY